MDDDYKLGYPASEVLQRLGWVENSEKVLLDTRWSIVKVLWDRDYSWADAADNVLQVHAVERAMQSPEDALRLVIEILGEDSQVDWFWNSCQGHYAAVTAFERPLNEGAIGPEWHRPTIENSATGGTMALAILTALVRVKARLSQIKEERKKAEPEANSEVAS